MTHEEIRTAKAALEGRLNHLEKYYWKYDAKIDAAEEEKPQDADKIRRLSEAQRRMKVEQETILATLRTVGWDYKTEDQEDREVGTIYRYTVFCPLD